MYKFRRNCVSTAVILSLLSLTAKAQTSMEKTSMQKSQTADAASESATNMGTVVVTGTGLPQRRFDASYSVNTLSSKDLQDLAPRTYSDMLANFPGIQVESSGGEVQEITRVRGLPGDRFGFVVQQDGVPLFHDIDGVFFDSGDGMNRIDLMTQRVEIVRGGPAPIFASSAAVIANNITVTGSEKPKGAFAVTGGTGGLYRLDSYYSGPLNEDTYYAVGGFLRYNQGLRDNGFPTDEGGQIRANIKHDISGGFVKLSYQHLDDHNVFDLPIPTNIPPNAGSTAYPTVNPGGSLSPYIDYFTGTMNTPALRNVNISYYNNGVLTNLNRDLANGRHITFDNVGFQYQKELDNKTINFKSSLTKGVVDFDALYSTTNPVDGNTYLASQLAAAQGSLKGTSSLGYVLAGTNTAYNPYKDSSLVMQAQYRYSNAKFYSFDNDLNESFTFDTSLGRNTLTAGAYTSFWGMNYFYATQDYLMQVKSQPQLLDMVAYSSTGSSLGTLTQNGALHDTTGLYAGNTDAKMFALYLNDTWALSDKLKLDAGVRHEWINYYGYDLNSTAQALPGTNLSSTFARGFNGTSTPINMSPSATNWTTGLNYDFSNNLGVYGRYSHLVVPPQVSSLLATTPTASPLSFQSVIANQVEVGTKAQGEMGYLFLTGYSTYFNPLNASFAAFNPQTGANTTVSFYGTAIDTGIEADGKLQLQKNFSIDGAFNVANPQYRDFGSVTGASAAAIYGKQIVREPKVYWHVRPNYTINMEGNDTLNLYATYQFTGQRYVDVLNTTALPSYATLGLGAIFSRGKDWKLQLDAQNLTNAQGLTEGNTRSDGLAGQGTPNAIYGRPIFGRNFRLTYTQSL
jgi:outer membrane receptor protein involved in Fe transport